LTPHGPYQRDLELAQQLAETARAISSSYFRRELRSWSKTDGSLATEADLAVEDAIRSQLAHERPDDAMLGEERGLTGAGSRRWIIDGIDGTVDFAAGSPDWGTLIALEVDGQVVVGVCDQPIHARRYWATKGGGAFCSEANTPDRRLTVSTTHSLSAARSYVPPSQWLVSDRARAIATVVTRRTQSHPHDNHPAIQVATGDSELALFMLAGPWDIAAPSLIVQEAGGRFTDLEGRYDYSNGTAVFSNGCVHDDILGLIQSAS
jgi:histidinol-phosphatase